VIGYGSIGRRHAEILSSLLGADNVHIVSRQEAIPFASYKDISSIDILEYDYFVISNETSEHYRALKYICEKTSNKKILVEKPLFSSRENRIDLNGNSVCVAYNLRFHPVLEKLNEMLKDKKLYYINAFCGQYLPLWRPDQDYRESYSASISSGGGVLRDLSHEIDYCTWLCGEVERFDSLSTKVSDLEINSDDITVITGVTERKVIFNISIDYISKKAYRRVFVHTENETFEADFIAQTITISNKNGDCKVLQLDSVDRNLTYEKMHKSFLAGDTADLCTIESGMKIVDMIENIEFKEI
jgi:predicted dehydrogenase